MRKGLERLRVVALVLAACNRERGRSHLALEDVNHDGKIVILAFGDSITRGMGDGPLSQTRVAMVSIASRRSTVPRLS